MLWLREFLQNTKDTFYDRYGKNSRRAHLNGVVRMTESPGHCRGTQVSTWFFTIKNGSHSILLYFKLLPLAVVVFFAAATEAETLQSNSDCCLYCVVLVHKYSNCYLTLVFHMHFTWALPIFTWVQAQVCPGADTPLVGEVFKIE